jgi:type VI secretion system protein ImpL
MAGAFGRSTDFGLHRTGCRTMTQTMSGLLAVLRDGQALLLGVSALVMLLLTLVLWLRLRRLRLVPEPAGPQTDLLAGPSEAMVLTPPLMRQAFRQGLAHYRQSVAGTSNPYLVPWMLAVGTRGGGTSTFCAAGGSAHPPKSIPDPVTGRPLGCAWWFYDRAVVIDVAGEAFADLRGERLPDGAWIALLEELVAAREGMPLDGILLTLPVPDLAGPEALPAAVLAAKAAEIHTRLWQMQKVTGLSLPVWLVLTMGDAIPGFQPLLAALPDAARDAAFGWSSPYPLEAAFQPGWVAEALESLQDAATAAALELGAAGLGDDAAAALRLPEELDRLRAPLAGFLGILFRQTGYQESLFLRGLWLTGAAGPPVAADQPPPLGFVRGLLAEKVFAERDLPRPVPRWSRSQERRRAVWRGVAGVAAVVLLGLLWSGQATLDRMRAGFVPALRAIAGPVALTKEASAGAAATEGAGPLAVIRAVARLDSDWQDPPWPIAALDTTADRMRTALAIGHWRLMMGDIRGVLLRRGQALAEGAAQAPVATGVSPELRELRRYLGEALLLERQVLTFNRLGETGGTVGLAEMLRYSHGIDLPSSYVDRAAELGFAELPSAQALRGASVEAGARPIDPAILREGLQPRLVALARDYLAGLVPPPDGEDLLRQAATRLAALAEGQGPNAPARLREATQALQAALAAARRDAPGLVVDGNLGGSEYRALLRVVSESRLLGPPARDAVLRASESAQFDTAATTVSAIGVGPLLVPAPDRNRMEPAAPASRLEAQLTALVARPFLQATPPPVEVVGPGLFRWQIPALEAAVVLADDQALFQLRDLPDFPEPLRPALLAASQQALSAALLDAVERAQLPAAGQDLAAVADQARAAHPVLLRLVTALRGSGAAADSQQLARAVAQQAQRLLEAAWTQLEDQAAYLPPRSGQLAWIDGKLDQAALYGLPDAALLPALLGREREKLRRLSDLAQPMLAVLTAPEMGELTPPAIAARWRGVVEEVQRSGQGRPGSLAGLERLIGQDIGALTPASCAELAVRGGGDWFADQAVRVLARLRGLCRQATQTLANGAWDGISTAFERLLAGRYPFAPLAAAERGPHASAGQVAEFYAVFDAQAAAALAALPADPRLADRTRHFIQAMQQAREVLKPLVGLDGVPPGLLLTPSFRALPEREQGGEAIIEWRLAGRSIATGTMSGQRPVPWRIGDPLVLSLRWARNAPVQPVQVLPRGPRAEAGTITLAARDPWALVTLVRRLAPPSSEWQQGPGETGPMLAISVQTAGDGEPPRTAPPARVFTSLGITGHANPPAGARRLVLPGEAGAWPEAAPRLGPAMPEGATP